MSEATTKEEGVVKDVVDLQKGVQTIHTAIRDGALSPEQIATIVEALTAAGHITEDAVAASSACCTRVRNYFKPASIPPPVTGK